MAFKKAQVDVPAPDILAQKKNSLVLYTAQFERAVHLVNETIENLGQINQNISQTIQEIDDYEKELAVTKSGLSEAKAKNDKVIANFKSLLCVE